MTEICSTGTWRPKVGHEQEFVAAWKSSPDFGQRMGRVREHVDGFEPAELTVVAMVASTAAPMTQVGGQG